MTRKARCDELRSMWKHLPRELTKDSKFLSWQGRVFALLACNPMLQSQFHKLSTSITDGSYRSHHDDERARDGLLAVMAQAINELDIPEEPPPPMALSDDHGILWFFHHCTWSVRWKLIALLATSVVAVFFTGFRVGMIDAAKDLYIQWTTSPSQNQPKAPSTAQPNP